MSAEHELLVLEEEVALKKLEVRYQEACEAYRRDKTADSLRQYKDAMGEFAAARAAVREKGIRPKARAGDAVVQPETVAAKSFFKRLRGSN